VVVAAGAGKGFVWNVDAEAWKRQACAVAGRTLTRDEWEQFLPDRGYAPACAGP
jgi:hypothetical protein